MTRAEECITEEIIDLCSIEFLLKRKKEIITDIKYSYFNNLIDNEVRIALMSDLNYRCDFLLNTYFERISKDYIKHLDNIINGKTKL